MELHNNTVETQSVWCNFLKVCMVKSSPACRQAPPSTANDSLSSGTCPYYGGKTDHLAKMTKSKLTCIAKMNSGIIPSLLNEVI